MFVKYFKGWILKYMFILYYGMEGVYTKVWKERLWYYIIKWFIDKDERVVETKIEKKFGWEVINEDH